MGCINGYCSNTSDIAISKDKEYTATIISNLLSNQMSSNKTNSKFLSLNSSRQDNNISNNSLIKMKEIHSSSNIYLNLPDNPLPFVKLKPKRPLC